MGMSTGEVGAETGGGGGGEEEEGEEGRGLEHIVEGRVG